MAQLLICLGAQVDALYVLEHPKELEQSHCLNHSPLDHGSTFCRPREIQIICMNPQAPKGGWIQEGWGKGWKATYQQAKKQRVSMCEASPASRVTASGSLLPGQVCLLVSHWFTWRAWEFHSEPSNGCNFSNQFLAGSRYEVVVLTALGDKKLTVTLWWDHVSFHTTSSHTG